ncbi:MAG: GNAT family N-acetyltransferase [Nitriliruptoraceae bacterium]
MSGESAEVRVRRVDERLGLAVQRVGLAPVTLVTYARDHVAVRTPSRPDFRDGNTLDLTEPPGPEQLERYVERFRESVGSLGARHVQLRWETPLRPDAPLVVPEPGPGLAVAAAELGLTLHPVTVLLLGQLRPVPEPDAQLVPISPPGGTAGGAVDRRWYAATVLYRYEAGDTPDDWRGIDQGFVDWSVEQQRALALADRCQVWIGLRHGTPVARLTITHDRQGLASVEDVVTHPVHRRIGIASALTHRAVAAHLEVYPGSRVGLGAVPASEAERLYRRLGFVPHATVWSAFAADATSVSGRTPGDGER